MVYGERLRGAGAAVVYGLTHPLDTVKGAWKKTETFFDTAKSTLITQPTDYVKKNWENRQLAVKIAKDDINKQTPEDLKNALSWLDKKSQQQAASVLLSASDGEELLKEACGSNTTLLNYLEMWVNTGKNEGLTDLQKISNYETYFEMHMTQGNPSLDMKELCRLTEGYNTNQTAIRQAFVTRVQTLMDEKTPLFDPKSNINPMQVALYYLGLKSLKSDDQQVLQKVRKSLPSLVQSLLFDRKGLRSQESLVKEIESGRSLFGRANLFVGGTIGLGFKGASLGLGLAKVGVSKTAALISSMSVGAFGALATVFQSHYAYTIQGYSSALEAYAKGVNISLDSVNGVAQAMQHLVNNCNALKGNFDATTALNLRNMCVSFEQGTSIKDLASAIFYYRNASLEFLGNTIQSIPQSVVQATVSVAEASSTLVQENAQEIALACASLLALGALWKLDAREAQYLLLKEELRRMKETTSEAGIHLF